MDMTAQRALRSQNKFSRELSDELLVENSFLLLSGEGGSGRTSILEQVVNNTDGQCNTVFIPCHKDMPLERLRELFLQQLMPGSEIDTHQSINDSLEHASLPSGQRCLVVVDDADQAIKGFYDELHRLHGGSSDQQWSFLLAGPTLWCQSKLRELRGDRDNSGIREIPPIEAGEALELCRSMFSARGLDRIFSALEGRLPDALESCGGNVGKVIEFTERLMKDPNAIKAVSQGKGSKAATTDGAKPKKRKHGAILFIGLLCVAIVIACLVPLFMGGHFFGSLFGGGSDQQEETYDDAESNVDALFSIPEDAAGADLLDENGQLRQPGSATASRARGGDDMMDDFADEEDEEADEGESARPAPRAGGRANSDIVAALMEGAEDEEEEEDDFGAGDDRSASVGKEDLATEDRGQLREKIPEGPVAEVPPKDTSREEVIAGEDLAKIERRSGAGSEEDADYPTRSVDEALNLTPIDDPEPPARPAAPPEPEVPVIARGDNRLHAAEAAVRREQKPAPAPLVGNAPVPLPAGVEPEAPGSEPNEGLLAPVELHPVAEAPAPAAAPQPRRQEAAPRPAPQQQAQAQAPRPAPAQQPAPQQAQPRRPLTTLRVGQVVNLGEEQARARGGRQARSAAAPAPAGASAPAGNSELAAKSSGRYTIQVQASYRRGDLAAAAASLSGSHWIYETTHNGRPWYVLITGDYGSAREAQAAISSLPAAMRAARPFVQSFGTVKQRQGR